LGRFWGAEALGIYGRSYQIISIPTENLNGTFSEIAFATLSRLQDDPVRLRSYFLKGYSLIIALTVPMTMAIALFPQDLITVVLGAKWNEAAPILRLLAPTILIFAFINPLGCLLYAIGAVGRCLRVSLVLTPLVIVAYLIGLPYGPKGVAIAFSTVMTLWAAPHIAWGIHGTVVSFRDILVTIGPPLLSGIVGGAAAFAVEVTWGPMLTPILRLFIGTTVLLSVYFLMLLHVLGQKPLFVGLVRGLISRGNPKSA